MADETKFRLPIQEDVDVLCGQGVHVDIRVATQGLHIHPNLNVWHTHSNGTYEPIPPHTHVIVMVPEIDKEMVLLQAKE